MNKLYCQESVKILSSLIMQFLSINDIPPILGETHPCANRMWQLHPQQSLLALRSCQRWMPPAWEALTGPLRKVNPGKSQFRGSVTAQPHPRTTPATSGCMRGKRGDSSHFHLFIQTKICSCWKVWYSFHEVFFFSKIRLQYFFKIKIQKPWIRKAPPPWAWDSSVTSYGYQP